MRVWDINPGYLNRQSLLAEHREIHGLFNIIKENKKGYSRHPETLRWINKLPAVKKRHDLLISEMTLRNYQHHTPMPPEPGEEKQQIYVDTPEKQFAILKEKYKERNEGRIPLPRNCQQLWAHHKYSIMARDPDYYRKVGPRVSQNASEKLFEELSGEFAELLSESPPYGRLLNAVQHMWGYISKFEPLPEQEPDLPQLMEIIRKAAFKYNITYLIQSTALSDLAVYC